MKQWIYIVDGFYMVLVAAEIEAFKKSNATLELVKEVSMHAAKMYYAFFKTFQYTSVENAEALYDWSAE